MESPQRHHRRRGPVHPFPGLWPGHYELEFTDSVNHRKESLAEADAIVVAGEGDTVVTPYDAESGDYAAPSGAAFPHFTLGNLGAHSVKIRYTDQSNGATAGT